MNGLDVVIPIKYDNLPEMANWCREQFNIEMHAVDTWNDIRNVFNLYRCAEPWDIFVITFKSYEDKTAFIMRYPHNPNEWEIVKRKNIQ